jgi:hypothetical protein
VFIVEKPSYLTKNRYQWLERAVPVLSFGGVAVALLAEMLRVPLDIHYPASGCVAASVILAYLAYTRPRKDIVAISTPIYAIIFFLVPSDSAVGIMLMFLYATSLTILLVRLKRRFGSTGPNPDRMDEGPLFRYITRTGEAIGSIRPDIAADAGRVFILFAQGEYDRAYAIAQNYQQVPKNEGNNTLATAFALITGYCAQCMPDRTSLLQSRNFPDDAYTFLFHPAPDSADTELESAVALDNALLLLYAVAMVFAGEEQREQIRSFHPFAEKLASLKSDRG